ncbi:putative conjugal transfer protein TrbB [Planctomycetales bacterium]|nr:putative conjugal transfer protein TrbB [Planctomycetales bacterium]GHS99020.1 putative conjugal transfer protein TrbB [Planctomycetales bacterium]GHT03714.1 putative conjugal transfer protein TrbB [Planctomycetales bacterium]
MGNATPTTTSQTTVVARDNGMSGLFNAKHRGQIESLKSKLGATVVNALTDPRTIEVMLNPDGILWRECFGEPMKKIGYLGADQARNAMGLIAGCFDLLLNADNPILECELPLDGSRFAGTVPPVSDAPCFAIRKKANAVFTLDDYVAKAILTERQCEVIWRLIAERKNILVVGGTGSGKTTFANAVLHEITQLDPDCRQVIIEDTYELQSTCPNRINFCTSVKCSATELLKVTLRLRPDRIIVGEMRDGVAHDLLQCWNTGHPGGISTVHANDCLAALNRVVNLVSQSKNAPRVIEPDVAIAVNALVCIQKNPAKQFRREVTEIRFVDGYDKEQGFVTHSSNEG